jgi:hypothetical protein
MVATEVATAARKLLTREVVRSVRRFIAAAGRASFATNTRARGCSLASTGRRLPLPDEDEPRCPAPPTS